MCGACVCEAKKVLIGIGRVHGIFALFPVIYNLDYSAERVY